jgi:hypothetical protein
VKHTCDECGKRTKPTPAEVTNFCTLCEAELDDLTELDSEWGMEHGVFDDDD